MHYILNFLSSKKSLDFRALHKHSNFKIFVEFIVYVNKQKKFQHQPFKAEKTYLQVLRWDYEHISLSDFFSFSGMRHASATTKLYITTYAKFVSYVEFVTEKFSEGITGEDDLKLKVSRKLSSEISAFVKLKLLQEKVKENSF